MEIDEEEDYDETEDQLDFEDDMYLVAVNEPFEDTCFPGLEDGKIEEEEEHHLC